MKKILVTGFDPFGGEKINPAFEAVKKIPDVIDGVEIIKLEIPTVFHDAIETTIAKAKEVHPDVILCVGQAGGRFEVTPERVAINCDDARIPDNKGKQPLNQPIYADGEAAYFSNLPVKAMVEAIKAAGVPSSLSNTAGTFVCNHIMYGVLYHVHHDDVLKGVRAGFIHVPYMLEQVVNKPNMASMNLDDMAKGLTAAVNAIIHNDQDIDIVAGKIE